MLDFELPKEVTRIWDLYVPYVKSTDQLDVYLNTGIDEPSCYSEVCYILSTLTEDETVYFHINTPGGVLDSAFQLVDAIKGCRATTVAKLTGTVASAGTIIALSCDKLIVAEHTSFMIHNYSAHGISGKAQELKAYQAHTEKTLEASFKSIYAGFLTDKEIKTAIDGQDLWMGKEEVEQRFARRAVNAEVSRADYSIKPTRGRPKKVTK